MRFVRRGCCEQDSPCSTCLPCGPIPIIYIEKPLYCSSPKLLHMPFALSCMACRLSAIPLPPVGSGALLSLMLDMYASQDHLVQGLRQKCRCLHRVRSNKAPCHPMRQYEIHKDAWALIRSRSNRRGRGQRSFRAHVNGCKRSSTTPSATTSTREKTPSRKINVVKCAQGYRCSTPLTAQHLRAPPKPCPRPRRHLPGSRRFQRCAAMVSTHLASLHMKPP